MIKLLIGGSPCTYWSIAQKNNRETKAEGLGWELFKNYLIAKEKFQPDIFLYENNVSASKQIKEQIKKELKVWDGTLFMEDSGARYIEINSALVSAQNRQRFYVHNCGEVEQPEDRGILLKDILESGENLTQGDKSFALTTRCVGAIPEDTIQKHRHTMVAEPVENVGNCETIQKAIPKLIDKYGYLPEQFCAYNLAEITDKSPTLSTGSMVTSSCATTIFEKTDKPLYEVKDGKITIKGKQYPIKLADGYYIIRKLTVTECARLQTMPDGYCKYGREISKQIFNRGNDKWQNAKLTVVKENAKAMRATVLCTTSGGKDMELSNCLKGILSNAKFAVRLQLQKDCVQSIIKISKNTETQDTLITYEAVLTNMDTKNINTRITKLNIEPLLKKCSVDNSQKMILSTILTLISQTMMNATCIYVPKANTVDYIMNLKNVQQNCIEWELLSLKTDTIDLMSASQSYKGLGNGWTAEVIIHILNGALKSVPKDEEIIVLSMYDGIGTGRYCLDKMGFTNVKYYAYEIDKYAKQIAMSNYPDIIQMGDAFDLRKDEWRLY